MDNRQVAQVLETIAHILEIKGENPFKIRAYQNAARAIRGLTTDLGVLLKDGKLMEVPGIGEALCEKISQLVSTGRLDYYEELRKDVPDGVLEMLHIPTLGPKKAKILWKELGIEGVEALRQACIDNKLLALKGFGEKSQKKLLEGIEFVSRHRGEYLLSDSIPLARRLLAYLADSKFAQRVSLAGSIRRWKEIVRDIDLLASSSQPAALMEHLIRAPGVTEVLAKGDTKTSVRMSTGIQVDLRVVTDEQFPYALAYFTGSKEHNVALRTLAQKKGLKVSEYGIYEGERLVRCKDEHEFYAALGLPYIPPEMRENTGELDLLTQPQPIDYKQLRGVFHTHSTWSDGTARLEDMARRAREMGLSYMGISDHSEAAAYANGMDAARLAQQMEEVDRLNREWTDFRILKGLECDILPDGSLDLNPEILGRLDFVIGSIHSRFDMPEKEMTERVCRALRNEHLDMLGHPTGRLLLSREGYRIDLERVLETARECDKMIELNAYPNRLDLDWIHCRRAKDLGVLVSINPDAHSTADLDNIEYGVATARRGWLGPEDVLNTRDLDGVLELLQS